MWIPKEQLGKCGDCSSTAFRTTFQHEIPQKDIWITQWNNKVECIYISKATSQQWTAIKQVNAKYLYHWELGQSVISNTTT